MRSSSAKWNVAVYAKAQGSAALLLITSQHSAQAPNQPRPAPAAQPAVVYVLLPSRLPMRVVLLPAAAGLLDSVLVGLELLAALCYVRRLFWGGSGARRPSPTTAIPSSPAACGTLAACCFHITGRGLPGRHLRTGWRPSSCRGGLSGLLRSLLRQQLRRRLLVRAVGMPRLPDANAPWLVLRPGGSAFGKPHDQTQHHDFENGWAVAG